MNILEQFMNSKYKDFLFEYDKEVVGIVVCGSRVSGVETENSDYDLNVIIASKPSDLDSRYVVLNEDGEKIHWYFHNINDIKNASDYHSHLKQIFLMQIGSLTKDKFLYVNKKYERLLDQLLSEKNEISNRAIISYLSNEVNYNNIKKISNQDKVKYIDYKKTLFRYVYIHHLLFDSDREFVRRIHSIQTNPLSKEESDKVIQICRDLIQYIDGRK